MSISKRRWITNDSFSEHCEIENEYMEDTPLSTAVSLNDFYMPDTEETLEYEVE